MASPALTPYRRSVLIGREAETALVARAVAEAVGGRRLVLVLEGEAGVGKTALLDAGAEAARRTGATVLQAACDPFGRDQPFGPVLDALAGAGPPADDRVGRLLDRLAEGSGPGGALESGSELRALLLDAVVRRLEELAHRGPVALLVDDLHWADPATLRTLASLVRRVTDLPLLVALATRPGPRPAELDALLRAVGPGDEVIAVAPLDAADVARLARRHIGSEPGTRLAELLARCGGNPLLVVEVLAALADAGLLTREGPVVEAAVNPARGPLPATFGEVVRGRMARLQGDSQALAALASLLGARFTVADLVAVTGRPVVDVAAATVDLVRSQVLVDDGGALSFRHDLVREAVAGGIPPSVGAELHRSIAEALRAAGAPLALVAEHVAQSANSGSLRAVATLQAAAAQVMTRDPTTAVSLARRALELCPPTTPRRHELTAILVDALAWSGRVVEAQQVADRALASPVGPEVEERLRSALGRALLLLGRPHEAIPHEERLIELSHQQGRSGAWALAECATCRLFALDVDRALAEATEAAGAAVADGDRMAEILALCVQVFAGNALGRSADAVAIGRRAVALADATPGTEGHRLHPHLFLGIALLTAGDREEARRSFRHGRSLGEELGAAWALPVYHVTEALAHWDAGEWDALLAEVEAGASYEVEHPSSIGQVWAHATAARVRIHRGELAEAEASIARGDALLAEHGLQIGAEWLILTKAHLLEAQARPAEAVELLRAVWDAAAALQASASLVILGAELTRLAVGVGDEATAERAVAALGAVAAKVPGDRVVGGRERRARGLFCRDADAVAAGAADLWAVDHRFEAALAEAEAGELLAVAGRTGEARRSLETALHELERIGAVVDGERVRARLARIAPLARRPPARRAVTGWGALTPTEREVAEEVCAGRSNGEVAERLGVSRRTVEAHLRSVYAKVGVSTRLALAVDHRDADM